MSHKKEDHESTDPKQTPLIDDDPRWQSCPPTEQEANSLQHDNQPEGSEGAIQIESTRGMTDYEFEQFLRFNKEILPQLAETVGVQLDPVFVPDAKEWHLPIEGISRLNERLSEQEQLTDFE